MSETTKCELPYAVRRIIGRYGPAIREQLYQLIIERYGHKLDSLNWSEVGECVGAALAALSGDGLRPDPRMVRLSREQFAQGLGKTTEDYLNELNQRMVAERNSKKDCRLES